MDNVVDDLIRIAQKCEQAFAPFEAGPVNEMNERLLIACNEIGQSWCGSNIGYHATIYLAGFRKPRPGEFFNREWGLSEPMFRPSSQDWQPTNYDTVQSAIMARARVSSLDAISNAALYAAKTFQAAKEELLPALDALLSEHEDKAIREQRKKLAELPPRFDMQDLARNYVPKGQFVSRDMLAMTQGLSPALHIIFFAG
jgi:hypothetical protein